MSSSRLALDAMSTKTLLKCRGAFNNWALVEETRRGWKRMENLAMAITEHSGKRLEDLATIGHSFVSDRGLSKAYASCKHFRGQQQS